MTRVSSVVMLIITLLAAPLAAEAQPAGRVYRIGWLDVGAPESVELKTFRKALEDLGYVEGRNIVVELCLLLTLTVSSALNLHPASSRMAAC